MTAPQKTALITGATSGFGLVVAEQMAKRLLDVIESYLAKPGSGLRNG